jgi:hypothetical protein
MDALTIFPKTKEQEVLYKQLAKTLQNHVVTTKVESPYNPEFVEKIKKGEKAAKQGKQGLKVNLDKLWK